MRENIEKPVRKTNINKKPKAIFITRDSQYIEYKSGIDLLVPTLLSGISPVELVNEMNKRDPAAF